jgi:hypothetical protein
MALVLYLARRDEPGRQPVAGGLGGVDDSPCRPARVT